MPDAEEVNPKTGMTPTEIKEFVRNHWEELINRKNLNVADVNFAPEYEEHGADVPPGVPPGPAGAKQFVGGLHRRFPDIHVDILDLIAEDDRVVGRNQWTGTEATSGVKHGWSGIVIWRVAHRQLVERWAYLTLPEPIQANQDVVSTNRWTSRATTPHAKPRPDADRPLSEGTWSP